MSDYDILSMVAQNLGIGNQFTQGNTDWLGPEYVQRNEEPAELDRLYKTGILSIHGRSDDEHHRLHWL